MISVQRQRKEKCRKRREVIQGANFHLKRFMMEQQQQKSHG